LKDSYRHKGLRRNLINTLRDKGIQNEKVLAAMATLPRHFFLEKAFEEWAYQDKAFPIGNDQTISQPYTVAYQTILLEVKKKDKILEIGTGSGYQAAILAFLEANVFTIERQEELYKKTSHLLEQLGIGVRSFFGDGYKGLPRYAPFDKILVTAGASNIPEALKAQLKIGGLLIIPVGDSQKQKMYKIKRLSEKDYEEVVLDTFRFVPFLKGVNKNNLGS